MKNFERNFLDVVNGYAEDYGIEGVLNELFPGQSIGEILLDMYNLGGIPEDSLERFLTDDDETDED